MPAAPAQLTVNYRQLARTRTKTAMLPSDRLSAGRPVGGANQGTLLFTQLDPLISSLCSFGCASAGATPCSALDSPLAAAISNISDASMPPTGPFTSGWRRWSL